MIIFNEDSWLNSFLARTLNYILLFAFIAGLFGIKGVSFSLLEVVLLSFFSPLLALMITRIAVKKTNFFGGDVELNKKDSFTHIYFGLCWAFVFLTCTSILIAIQMWHSMKEGCEWLLLLPTIIFLINALNVPDLHEGAFGDILSLH